MKEKIIILTTFINFLYANIEQIDILNKDVKNLTLTCSSSNECIEILNSLKTQKDLLAFGGFAKELCEIEYDFFNSNEAKFKGCDEFLNLFEANKITDFKKDIIKYKNITCKLGNKRCGMYGEYLYNIKNLKLSCEYGFEPACYEIY